MKKLDRSGSPSSAPAALRSLDRAAVCLRAQGIQALGIVVALCIPSATGCGARASLDGVDEGGGDPGGTGLVGSGASPGAGGAGLAGSAGGSGGAPCLSAPEVCNGVDDDCNGLVDESDPAAGEACLTGQPGACSEGIRACAGGVLVCAAEQGPSGETCNGIDDDCDGTADEELDCTKRVFITSQVYTGDLGGLAGGDAKCQALADAAGLGGVYKAWLSASTASAAERLSHGGKPYVLVDGTVVADDWTHLTSTYVSGPLSHAIDLTELMGPAPVYNPQIGSLAWTGTHFDGTLVTVGCRNGWCSTCDDWTNLGGMGLVGGAAYADNGWSYIASGGQGNCTTTPAALYCFEQ